MPSNAGQRRRRAARQQRERELRQAQEASRTLQTFGPDVDLTLLSHGQALSYASLIVLEGSAVHSGAIEFERRSSKEKLAFYQSLTLQFELCLQSDLPSSIKECQRVLRYRLHIAVGEYLDVVKRGGNVASEVTRFLSASKLRAALRSGLVETVPRDLIKTAFLQVFMVAL